MSPISRITHRVTYMHGQDSGTRAGNDPTGLDFMERKAGSSVEAPKWGTQETPVLAPNWLVTPEKPLSWGAHNTSFGSFHLASSRAGAQ